jgi:hypothetical protein
MQQEVYRCGFKEQGSVTSTASDFELKQVFTGHHLFLGQSEHKTTQSPSEQCARSEICHNINWCEIELSCYSGYICHGNQVLLIAAVGMLAEIKEPAFFPLHKLLAL